MELQDNEMYNISELAQAKLHPINNTREYISKMVNKDFKTNNVLDTIRVKWDNNLGYTYRVTGAKFKYFIAMRGYLNEN